MVKTGERGLTRVRGKAEDTGSGCMVVVTLVARWNFFFLSFLCAIVGSGVQSKGAYRLTCLHMVYSEY